MCTFRIRRLSGLCIALLMAACVSRPTPSPPEPPHSPELALPSEQRKVHKPSREVEVADLTLEEKVGQVIMVRASGQFANNHSAGARELRRWVEERHVGGIITFLGSVDGTIQALNLLQGVSRLPLLVASDFERGPGQQADGGTLFPSEMAVAAAGDTALARKMGEITAREARALGVHMIFSPVLDINNNPANPIINFRAFGDSPDIVARFGIPMIEGLQANGVIATAKHFPGHGNTSTDSHTTLPVIPGDSTALEAMELFPFRRAVKAGVKAVMVGHLSVPGLDSTRRPATLSPALTTKLLRERMGFDGLVVTDGMEMGGITKGAWSGEAAVEAIEAGADIILLPLSVDGAVEGIVEAVRRGRIAEARIDESVEKILRAKRGLQLFRERFTDPAAARELVGSPESQQVAQQIARGSITLVKDERSWLPVTPERYSSLAHIVLATEEGMLTFSTPFREAIAHLHGNAASRFISEPLSPAVAREVAAWAREKDAVLVSVFVRVQMNVGTVSLHPSHRKVIEDLRQSGKHVIVVSFGSPYLADVDSLSAYVCAYGYGKPTVVAAAQAVVGAAPFGGTLPVTLSPKLRQGHGVKAREASLGGSDGRWNFAEARSVLEHAVADSIFPGAQAVVTASGKTVAAIHIGRLTYSPDSPLVTDTTRFDIASLTKVVATTPVTMTLAESKHLSIDEPVSHFFPEFSGDGREWVTLRHLLTHTAGLPPFVQYYRERVPPEAVLDSILALPLDNPPGTQTVYSDLGMILLGAVVAKATGRGLDELAQERIFSPLGMMRTQFNPPPHFRAAIAPTEVDTVYRKGLVQGIVHDENAWWLGGVAGHAGVFSTASDLSKLARMMLSGGFLDGKRLFAPQTVQLFTARQISPSGTTRALGWDTPSDSGSSAGDFFSKGSYGHLGFTGTSIWIDPLRKISVVLLTNRVHPSRERQGIYDVRRNFHNAVMRQFAEAG